MERLADLPDDMVFMTQITMEAAEDPAFLDAMRKAHIRGALVGVESVTQEGLKAIYKDFNLRGDALVDRLKVFRQHGVHVLGSFIFGLPTDTAETFDATAALAQAADVTFAQFVLLQPFPGTVDFEKWEKAQVNPRASTTSRSRGTGCCRRRSARRSTCRTRACSPRRSGATPSRSGIGSTALPAIWKRAKCMKSLKGRLAFMLISKLYRQMYANTGIATDSARHARANRMARLIAKPCRRLFVSPGSGEPSASSVDDPTGR